ncbi:T9SS type A sorting domain-containing protein [Chryseobacterium chendengshani]|uniref:T9SS type A sorting domain-containing protein n=1 Tax=Chryseobacterium sp. LJ756 TaxID=2864113 RepID=UPI001C644733|nr:T9SS type A sorting domain-containing protein [Chryseobacterium sp. LJ756]MBW7674932.1 TonB-dependent receptor plug domain-containing protein [Chryseobacterium sp. LJ756]
MENNHDIDKKFNDASQSVEEPATFPGFEKVWAKVEEKLDKKENKKRIIPIWFPYGIAASLVIGLGAFYFIDKKEVVDISKPNLVQNTVSPKVNPKVQAIDSTVKSNIEKEIESVSPLKIRKNDLAINTYSLNPNYIIEADDKTELDDKISSVPEIWNDTLKVKDIEEVVVMGYATKVYRNTTSSSTALTASTDKSSISVNSVLSGSVAGVKINSGSEIPGSSKIMIRGMNSLGKDSSPLFVIDGIVAGKNSKFLNILDPKKIKEIKVIKDFEATSLYGSRASNGVILVTTKGLSESEKQKIKKIASEKSEELIIEPKEEEKELPKAGLLTAGEVNDFSKWNYWNDIAVPTLDEYKNVWKFFPERRVSVQLVNQNKKPVIGEKIKLLNDKKEVIWEAVSDNFGNAELWINPLKDEISTSGKFYLSDSSGQIISSNVRDFKNGQNLIILDKTCLAKRTLDIAFVVDATGSMGDEISYLQSELLDVLKNVESKLKNTNVRYGSVFYRDHGDEYVTRKFDFSDEAENLIDFIKKQKASGGGDFPEAVVEAMGMSVNELKWSEENSTKIMFLILDAPPHQSKENIEKLFRYVKMAAKKGITIIPLAASDADKQTEYLMRTFALLTNGTYTFLTNDSGIGNNHIKPTIDSYEVEKLNDLLIRLILQRSTLPECNDGISNNHLNKKLETELDHQVDSKVIIYPNPTKGLIDIKTKKVIDELFVYDLAGKIIMRKENLTDNKSIDITAYPQSIYLLRLRFNDQWETFKIIKK